MLWIINIVLALAFAAAGTIKLIRPLGALVDLGMTWVSDASPQMVRAVGVVELIGAAGLILPMGTRIAPGLTPAAAIGLACVMLAAVVVHLKRAESVVPPMVLGGLAVVSAAVGLALV